MNNNDRFEQAMKSSPIEAARLALEYSAGCGSKSSAWSWADRATAAAAEAGVTLDAGRASWPDIEAMERQINEAQRKGPEAVIISRHAGAVEWLRRQGITGTVIAQATPDDVRGRIVIGNLPLHLAALAVKVGSIDLPGLTREQRGADLTPEEMDAAGACIRWYAVQAL